LHEDEELIFPREILALNGHFDRRTPMTIFHNQHHWVTESGDTIFLGAADVTAIPTFVPGLFPANYPNIPVLGGTGRFAGAHGNITAFGAVDMNQGHIILRYQGNIFFAEHQP
jgi:hypothetical protein